MSDVRPGEDDAQLDAAEGSVPAGDEGGDPACWAHLLEQEISPPTSGSVSERP